MIVKPWLNPKVKILTSNIHGLGFFAENNIQKNEIIVIWKCDCYTNREGAIEAKKQGKKIMQWDDDIFSYEIEGDNAPFSINHSCQPNAWLKDAYTLVAIKNIDKGEEITADYALWEEDENYKYPWTCECNSSICRKNITGADWKKTILQKKYGDHFSPLINKKIKYQKK